MINQESKVTDERDILAFYWRVSRYNVTDVDKNIFSARILNVRKTIFNVQFLGQVRKSSKGKQSIIRGWWQTSSTQALFIFVGFKISFVSFCLEESCEERSSSKFDRLVFGWISRMPRAPCPRCRSVKFWSAPVCNSGVSIYTAVTSCYYNTISFGLGEQSAHNFTDLSPQNGRVIAIV